MKRAAQERMKTLTTWRRHLATHVSKPDLCACELQPGRFRKGQRIGGCGKAKCYVCHCEKLLKKPRRPQRRSDESWREWRRALRAGAPAAPNTALQTDKGDLSCLLHSQKSRQLDFAAELGR
jgi:hypothetical protein